MMLILTVNELSESFTRPLFDIHETEQNRVSTNDEPAKKSSGSTSELNDKLSHLEVLEMQAPPRKSLDSNSDESLTEIT